MNFVQKQGYAESITTATMVEGDKKDTYQFDLTDTKRVNIKLIPKSGKVLIFYLKDNEGNNLLMMHNDVMKDPLYDEIGLPAGKYTIEVVRKYNTDIPYTLGLSTSTDPAYEVEGNDSFKTANPIKVNKRYEAAINQQNTIMDDFLDKDYFKFTVVYSGKYKLKTSESARRFHLYNADEERVKFNDDNTVNLTPGTYYLNTESTTGNYHNISYWFEMAYVNTPKRVMWGKTELVKGQLGKVTVKKSATLWKRYDNGKLEKARTLQPGEEYRVYRYLSEKNGLYGVGGGLFIEKNSTNILYETPSKKNLNLVKLIHGEL